MIAQTHDRILEASKKTYMPTTLPQTSAVPSLKICLSKASIVCLLRRLSSQTSPARQKAEPTETPRPMRMRRRQLMAGLLARGSLLLTAFPVSQWLIGDLLAAYSCGGSHGIEPESPHRVP